MKRYLAVGFFTFLVIMNNPGDARAGGFETGNRLYTYCIAGDIFGNGFCNGYITGVMDALETGKKIGDAFEYADPSSGWRWCQPQLATLGQIKDVVSTWLKANPKSRHFGAASLVSNALADSWPCPR